MATPKLETKAPRWAERWPRLRPFERAALPKPFRLNNYGSICYFNSLLQMLASATAFTGTVLENEQYMKRTVTGTAVLAYVKAYSAAAGPAADISLLSSKVQAALVEDLRARQPNVKFGSGQQSASEALVLLLDMIEAPLTAEEEKEKKDALEKKLSVPRHLKPITMLFENRYDCVFHCGACNASTSDAPRSDMAVHMPAFHLLSLKKQPETALEFGAAMQEYISPVDDCKCGACGVVSKESKRVYTLRLVPEIAIVSLNVYSADRKLQHVPDEMVFQYRGELGIVHRRSAQVLHTGTLSGGHYVAEVERQAGPTLTNDSCDPVPLTQFTKSPNAYLVLFQYEKVKLLKPKTVA